MMIENTHATILSFQEKVNDICYAFYRYEINNGLIHLETLVTEFEAMLAQYSLQEKQLQELNELLQLTMASVEQGDFLITADLLKYELLERITQLSSPS